METSITTMQENLKYKLPNAAEIYYFKWNSSEPYTVIAAEKEKYGNVITLGYRSELDFLGQFDLPVYNNCPIN